MSVKAKKRREIRILNPCDEVWDAVLSKAKEEDHSHGKAAERIIKESIKKKR